MLQQIKNFVSKSQHAEIFFWMGLGIQDYLLFTRWIDFPKHSVENYRI